jgi:hypothetical protein
MTTHIIFAILCGLRRAADMLEHELTGEALRPLEASGDAVTRSFTSAPPPPVETVDLFAATVTNHEEALQLAHLLKAKSNLARCYIVLHSAQTPGPGQPDVADMVFWCRLFAEQWAKMDGADSIRAKRLREIADTLVRLSRSQKETA